MEAGAGLFLHETYKFVSTPLAEVLANQEEFAPHIVVCGRGHTVAFPSSEESAFCFRHWRGVGVGERDKEKAPLKRGA